jgi:hypothetical protein
VRFNYLGGRERQREKEREREKTKAAKLDKSLFLEGIRVGLDSCAEIASRIRQGKAE